MTEKTLSDKREKVYVARGKSFFIYSGKDVKEFIKKEDKIVIEEVDKTDGSIDFDLNNLAKRIKARRNKLAGKNLT